MLVTTVPPGGVAALKDLPNGRAHGFELEERLASQDLVDGSMAIDRGRHVDPAEAAALVVGCRLVGIEIDEEWMGDLSCCRWEEHDRGAVRNAAWGEEVHAGVAARDLRKVGQRIG